MLTLWDWKQEKIVLRSKAFSQDIFRITFSTELIGQLTTSGVGHIRYVVLRWAFSRSYCYTVAWYCHLSVCLSIRPSVMLCSVGLRVGIGGWKLYHRVTRRALPFHFITHFCCRMSHSATTHDEKRTAEISASGIAMRMTMAISDTAFLAVWFWSYILYVIHSTIGLPSDNYIRFL